MFFRLTVFYLYDIFTKKSKLSVNRIINDKRKEDKMKPIGPEIVFYWIATAFYGIAAVIQILAFIQKKKKLSDTAMNIAWLGLLAHSVNFFLPAVRHNYTGI